MELPDYDYYRRDKDQIALQSKNLIIGPTDFTFPNEYDPEDVQLIYNHYFRVYVQNLDRSNLNTVQSEKTLALPLGLDLHTVERHTTWGYTKTKTWKEQLHEILTIRGNSLQLDQRIPKILITWDKDNNNSHRHKSYKSRPALFADALKNPVCDIFTGNRRDMWNKMSQYAFVYSPIGNGFDCHRLWEALTLGCIVIVQDCPTLREFKTTFPIIIEDNLDRITSRDLQRWLKIYSSARLETLLLKNWIGNQEARR